MAMANLSTAGWAAHDIGLATAIGGSLFGQAALEPALAAIDRPEERDRVSSAAWQRFSWLNLAAHGVFAATWFFGRRMLTGREVSRSARTLTKVKDGLVVASLISGIASHLLGRRLGLRSQRGVGPEKVREGGLAHIERDAKRTMAIERTVHGLGFANLLANIGVAAVTTMLGMEATKSLRFSAMSRCLP
jgi:hypothetical protein